MADAILDQGGASPPNRFARAPAPPPPKYACRTSPAPGSREGSGAGEVRRVRIGKEGHSPGSLRRRFLARGAVASQRSAQSCGGRLPFSPLGCSASRRRIRVPSRRRSSGSSRAFSRPGAASRSTWGSPDLRPSTFASPRCSTPLVRGRRSGGGGGRGERRTHHRLVGLSQCPPSTSGCRWTRRRGPSGCPGPGHGPGPPPPGLVPGPQDPRVSSRRGPAHLLVTRRWNRRRLHSRG